MLLIVLDDLGIDCVGAYGTGFSPSTPNLDALAANGLRFTNVWSNPVCSPTRAAIQTGRYPFQTGVGDVIKGGTPGAPGLRSSEVTIAEAVKVGSFGSYSTGFFGKWHLSPADPTGPNGQGYDHYAGLLNNLVGNQTYTSYDWTVDGVTSPATEYLATKTVDSAINWISARQDPWLAVVSMHLAHTPFHAPPPGLHTRDLTTAGTPTADPRPYFEAMVEALDTEVGRLLLSIGSVRHKTTVFVLGDNGTNARVTPYDAERAKGTLYQSGIQVPLIVEGYRTSSGVSSALVNASDLFATIVELTGASVQATVPMGTVVNSYSLLSTMAQPGQSLRAFNFSQRFSPVGFDSSGESYGMPLQPTPQSGCQRDLGFAGPGAATISLCGLPLAAGVQGVLSVENGPPGSPVTVFISGAPMPVSLFGGTFVADLQNPVGVWGLDSQGSASIPLVSGDKIGPFSFVVQAIINDPAQPQGFSLTNALEVTLLPYNQVAVQDVDGYKAIFSVNAGDVSGAVQLFNLTTDPLESINLFPPAAGSVDETHYAALRSYRDQVLANP